MRTTAARMPCVLEFEIVLSANMPWPVLLQSPTLLELSIGEWTERHTHSTLSGEEKNVRMLAAEKFKLKNQHWEYLGTTQFRGTINVVKSGMHWDWHVVKTARNCYAGSEESTFKHIYKKKNIYIHGLNRHSFVITAILKIKTYVFLQLLNLVFIRYVSLC